MLGRIEGIIFILLFAGYMFFLASRHYFSTLENGAELKRLDLLKGIAFFIVGAAGLAFGAKYVVGGATKIAYFWGISETIIGISIVAVGTSLPEVAVVTAGSIRKQPEISIGTIIGSNIINILLIAGVASVITPIAIKSNEVIMQAPAVILFTLLLLPIIIDRKIKKFEGGILLALYSLYIYLIF
jgi:cation:H+ antiporter